jgi:histidinol-phosphate aminotransferase
MALEVPVPQHVGKVPPYQPGRAMASVAREFGLKLGGIIKLASNENPLGMSPRARAALVSAAEDPSRYPDADGIALREKLAARHGVPIDWILLGSGSAEILQLAARTFLTAERSAVISQYAFTSYVRETRAAGARPIVTPAKNFGHDPEAMRAAIAPDTSILYLANPNNPTGTYLAPAEMAALIAAVPPRVAIVLDEAYFDYLEPAERPDSIAWVRRHPNLVVARTFSKIYGMAGMRIGYGIAQAEMSELLNRLRLTFNVSVPAQAAAMAALEDEAFAEQSRALNRAGMAVLTEAFARMGFPVVPSKGNFIMVEVGDAAAIHRALLERGIIVRPVAPYGLARWLRITVGLPEENDAFLAALGEITKAGAKLAV